MGNEKILANCHPKSNRDVENRKACKTDENREIARRFGKEFFDGDRNCGYGGFYYNPKFWGPVVPTLINHWKLSNSSSFLDVGCAKGFLLYDLKQKLPDIHVCGIDISEYAIANAKQEVREFVHVANATELPFKDNSFDAVISINTIHNLEIDGCAVALQEIERVCKTKAFVTVDAYRTAKEKLRMEDWNLTAKTIMSASDWENFFDSVGYSGDYSWFIP